MEIGYALDYTSPLKNVIMESVHKLSAYGTLDTRTVYGLQKISSHITQKSPGVAASDITKVYSYHDRLGSVEYVTDSLTGAIVSHSTYEEWGAPTEISALSIGGESWTFTQYTVHPYDHVLGIFFAQARMYDAENRRFVEMDGVVGNIFNTQTLIRYSYVLNRPVALVDLYGLSATSANYVLHFQDPYKSYTSSTILGTPLNGAFKATDAYRVLGDLVTFLPSAAEDDYIVMSQLVQLLNAYVPGARGNDTGDYRGRYPGYFFKLSCDSGNRTYTISLEPFTSDYVNILGTRFRNNTASVSDFAAVKRLQSSYSPYEYGWNLYKEFLFFSDPNFSKDLTSEMLNIALNAIRDNRNIIPRFNDPVIEANIGCIAEVYMSTLAGYSWGDLFGYLHGMSIIEFSGGIYPFITSISDTVAEYRSATSHTEKTVYEFNPPRPFTNANGQITNGIYTVDSIAMNSHKTGSTTSGKTNSCFM